MSLRGFTKRSYTTKYLEPKIQIGTRWFENDSMTNVRPSILSKIDSNLLQQPGHPLNRVKTKIYNYFNSFLHRDITDPVVTVKQNFDDLGFPADHVGRTLNDSYYLNNKWMLRTHMTAHEREMIQEGHRSFLLAGSVFRRDEIDATHYPVFHQLEGVNIFKEVDMNLKKLDGVSEVVKMVIKECQPEHDPLEVEYSLCHLQTSLNGLLRSLFGDNIPIRWQPCYFPFTQPSLEAEIEYRGRWVEVLGSGLLQSAFLEGSGIPLPNGPPAWAFGLGIERIAMILYDIPDIRLFWSKDRRFLDQFEPSVCDEGLRFRPFSKYQHIARDLSFWIPPDFNQNCLFDLVRGIAGDLVESVEMIDRFVKGGKESQCFRIIYRAMDRSLTDEEVNVLQDEIRAATVSELKVQLR